MEILYIGVPVKNRFGSIINLSFGFVGAGY